MARKITDFDGSTIAVGGAYPFGDIKDNPSGTVVNRKSNADMQQFFQKIMFEANITPNSLPENSTNGWQLVNALQTIASRYAAQIIISMLGDAYDNTKVYVLYGTAGTTVSMIFYNSNIYYLRVPTPGPCADTLVIRTDGLMVNGIMSANVYCGVSGSGIADLADVIYFNSWVDCRADLTFTGVGGTVTVALGDITYARYLLRGKTVQVQILVETATVGSGVTDITVDMSGFLPSDVVNLGADMIVGFSAGNGVLVGGFGTADTMTIYKASGGSFATGTDNQSFTVNVTVELA